MALMVQASLESGIVVEQSYARIDDVRGNKDKLMVYLGYYVDPQAANGGLPPFKQTVHEFVPSVSEQSLRWDKQGYEYIKTLTEFNGAIDA